MSQPKKIRWIEKTDKRLREIEMRLLNSCPIFFVRMERRIFENGYYYRANFSKNSEIPSDISLTLIFYSGRLNKEFSFDFCIKEIMLYEMKTAMMVGAIIDTGVEKAKILEAKNGK